MGPVRGRAWLSAMRRWRWRARPPWLGGGLVRARAGGSGALGGAGLAAGTGAGERRADRGRRRTGPDRPGAARHRQPQRQPHGRPGRRPPARCWARCRTRRRRRCGPWRTRGAGAMTELRHLLGLLAPPQDGTDTDGRTGRTAVTRRIGTSPRISHRPRRRPGAAAQPRPAQPARRPDLVRRAAGRRADLRRAAAAAAGDRRHRVPDRAGGADQRAQARRRRQGRGDGAVRGSRPAGGGAEHRPERADRHRVRADRPAAHATAPGADCSACASGSRCTAATWTPGAASAAATGSAPASRWTARERPRADAPRADRRRPGP